MTYLLPSTVIKLLLPSCAVFAASEPTNSACSLSNGKLAELSGVITVLWTLSTFSFSKNSKANQLLLEIHLSLQR